MDNASKNEPLRTKLTRDMLIGACCVCQRDAEKCRDDHGFKCQVFVEDEKAIAEILKDEADTTA